MNALKFIVAGLCVGSVAWADLVVPGNGNSGFGGMVGGGSLTIADDGVNVSFTFTRGASDFNLENHLVLFFDSVGGGVANTGSFTDEADNGRRAVSGHSGGDNATVNFAGGFNADFGLSYDAGNGAFLFALDNPANFIFVSAGGGGGAAPADASFNFTVPVADLGIGAGGSFEVVGTLINGTNAFRSDEGFGSVTSSGNPGGPPSSLTFSDSISYTTVPEPSAIGFWVVGFALLRMRFSRK